jgi:hypothetical protein
MAQQTFSVGREPRVVITQVQGGLTVRSWSERSIQVAIDGSVAGLQQEGNALMINDCDSDIELHVPEDTSISALNTTGDVDIEGVRLVKLENVTGDVTLRDISGDAELENVARAIELTNLGGDLDVSNSPAVRVQHSVGGDATLKNVAEVEIETVGGDLAVANGETAMVGTVGGDLSASNVAAALRCGVVGGDCQVQGSARTKVAIGNAGGDFIVSGAESLHAGNIGGDCMVRDVQGEVEVGYVGSDGSFRGVGGNLQVGNIGGDGDLKGIQGGVEVGSIGGDLELQSNFPVDTRSRLIVGGDAGIVIPDDADLSIRATVGGDVSGRSIITSRSGNLVNLIYGEGRAHLDLNVGGDLNLKGTSNPRSSSSASGSWNDFGREMSKLGQDLGKLGQDLGQEIASAFSGAGWTYGADFADDIARKAEEKARKAQRKAEEQARKATERAARINIRFNDREWRLDPERLERIREQARSAASEGITGALDAVERAMSNLRIPMPPLPRPPSGAPPVPPVPPMGRDKSGPYAPSPSGAAPAPAPQAQEGTTQDGAPGQQVPREDHPPVDLEQEREAILRMIAEGRVTPEEGDLLLEALGS